MDIGYYWDDIQMKWLVTSYGRVCAMYDDEIDAFEHFEGIRERLIDERSAIEYERSLNRYAD